MGQAAHHRTLHTTAHWCALHKMLCIEWLPLRVRTVIVFGQGLTGARTLYSTLYTVHCILYNVQCTMYNVQCTMYNVQYNRLLNKAIQGKRKFKGLQGLGHLLSQA